MSLFLRILTDENKEKGLRSVCTSLRGGKFQSRSFNVEPKSFKSIPGSPFAYWVSEDVRQTFQQLPSLEGDGRSIRVGLQTSDDFRFLRNWWEISSNSICRKWFPFAKGGAYSPFYADINLTVNWSDNGAEIRNFFNAITGKLNSRPQNVEFYFRPGLTWTVFTTRALSARILPSQCVLSHVGGAALFDTEEQAKKTLALFSSSAYRYLLDLTQGLADAGRRVYGVGSVGITPFVEMPSNAEFQAMRAWSLKRSMDTVNETSHAFLLPTILRTSLEDFNLIDAASELIKIQNEINAIAFNLFGFSETDRQVAFEQTGQETVAEVCDDVDELEEADFEAPPVDALFSWAVGVCFGRFDWRLATSERDRPTEPEPFDPLPSKSPGMLPDGANPFHAHDGILLDDDGHKHDLARLVEEVLNRVDVPVPDDVRRWLQKDFFAFHLQLYSKSRRKAPIYWPLSTFSCSYTLWIYYPSLNSQTLFTAVNDFLDGPHGKLTQVSREYAELRSKGSSRSREEEKQYETLQAFEQELTDLRDTLLKIAPNYQPNHDDGVQITAAPLWPLFRHKPWQNVLKDTWKKLEKGDYDWAHLAMAYWPDRVREKCKTDKSLAIAHGLEDLYVEPETVPKKTRAKKKTGANE